MVLASDTFNRSAGTLGPNWSEQTGTNMSCDGSFARIDSAPQAHIALAIGTSRQDTYFQCWLRGSDAANLVGLCWRFQNTTNYYTVRANNTSWTVLRVGGSGGTAQIGASFSSVGGTAAWHRVAVRHVGNRIQIYIDNLYDVVASPTRDGPVFDQVDSDAQGSVWSGTCGLISGSNNATGITNLQWNDFIAFDGTPETIYVDTTFNGGVAGEGMGTVDRPDLHIDWALNNAGLNRGGKLKLLEAGPVTNPTGVIGSQPGQFVIGHADKFSSLAFSYPEYDPENGSVTSPGNPNLIIEGMDGGRTLLQNVSTSRFFFTIRGDARGIVFRGMDEEKLVASNQGFIQTATSATVDHSFSVDKCLHRVKPTTGYVICSIGSLCSHVRTMYSYVTGGTFANVRYFGCEGASSKINKLDAKFNLSDSIILNLFTCRARPVDAGGLWDIDHNTMTADTATFDMVLLEFEAAESMLGTAIAQNNIVFFRGTSPGTPTALFALQFEGTPGPFISHHNGFSGSALDFCYGDPGNSTPALWTDRTGDICAPGVASGTQTPQFTDLAGTTDWQQTAGQGLNGEGTFTSMVVTNLRPLSPSYVDQADDSTPNLGVLDRGALQSFVPVGGFPIPGLSLPVEQARIFCPSVIFDPGGPQEFDLSSLILQATALRYERDILLRSYRASDVTIEFIDPSGLFVEQNPDSFLLGADGDPDWMGKKVLITVIFGTEPLTQYEGFVLEVEASEARGLLRIGNRFQQLFDRDVLANDVVRIEATNGAIVHPRNVGDATLAGYISRGGIDVHTEARAPVETLTFEFTSPTQFFVNGSVSDFEGEGNIATSFTTLSGSVTVFGGSNPVIHSGTARSGGSNTIQLALTASGIADFYNGMTITLTGGTGVGQQLTIIDYETGFFLIRRATVDSNWATVPDNTTTYQISTGGATWNQGAHTYVDGEKVIITLGWASSMLQNPPSANEQRPILDIYRDFLLSDQGGQLDAADLDASVDAMAGERNNQMAQPFVVDKPRTALEVVDELSLHMGAVTIEKANAKIGLRKLTPQLIASGSLDVLCSGDDLISVETAHLPIYNQFVFSYEYDPATQKFRSGFVFPDPLDDENPSLDRYGRLYPAPRPFEARAYSSAIIDNTEWLQLLSEILYRRYENPALVAKVKTKISRMDAELDDTYRLDSLAPPMVIAAMEPFSIDKNITGDLIVGMELVDVSSQVQEEGACGFLSYDTPGQGYDQCWGYF